MKARKKQWDVYENVDGANGDTNKNALCHHRGSGTAGTLFAQTGNLSLCSPEV